MLRTKKVSRNFKGYPQDKKVAFLTNVLGEMSPVTSQFQEPPVLYSEVTSELIDVRDAIKVALTKAPGSADLVIDAFDIVDVTFNALADYVDSLAQGNEIIILASGFVATTGEANAVVVANKPAIEFLFIDAVGEAGFLVGSLGDVTYEFIISTDLSGLKKVGIFFTNTSVGAQTFTGSSKQRRITVTGLPSKTDLFIACYATNTAGVSVLSNILPFSCK